MSVSDAQLSTNANSMYSSWFHKQVAQETLTAGCMPEAYTATQTAESGQTIDKEKKLTGRDIDEIYRDRVKKMGTMSNFPKLLLGALQGARTYHLISFCCKMHITWRLARRRIVSCSTCCHACTLAGHHECKWLTITSATAGVHFPILPCMFAPHCTSQLKFSRNGVWIVVSFFFFLKSGLKHYETTMTSTLYIYIYIRINKLWNNDEIW